VSARKAAKRVALLVDVESIHLHLRALHHRTVDPGVLLDCASEHGEVVAKQALAPWEGVPEDVKADFDSAEFEVVEVPRATRRTGGGRRRDVSCDTVGTELLARMVELLFPLEGGVEIDLFVVATCESVAARALHVIRERFDKPLLVINVEGVETPELAEQSEQVQPLPMPRMEPRHPELLERLVPLLEDLERRKRYLNFKYIREAVVRKLDVPNRSFELAERLLSDAIACGLLLKRKIEDKYNPGQQFTAYAIDRESEYFERWGSGEAAPEHPEPTEPPARTKSKSASERQSKAKPRGDSKRRDDRRDDRRDEGREDRRDEGRDDGRDDGQGGGKRKRRRRKRKGGAKSEGPSQLTSNRRGRGSNHSQDRVGRIYEAPSRFLSADDDDRPVISDDEIDVEAILRARGDD